MKSTTAVPVLLLFLILLCDMTSSYNLRPAQQCRGALSSLRSTLEHAVIKTTRSPPSDFLPFEYEVAPPSLPPALAPPPSAGMPKVWFVLGGPGAGKGTQSHKLSTEYGMMHISAGDLLRDEVASGSATGQLIAGYIQEGKIVPVEVTVQLLKRAIESAPCNRVLVDGFPRNHDNLAGWDRCMQGAAEVEGVVFLDCPENVMLERLLARGATSGRTDDNVETARKRFATYRQATMPVVGHFAAMNKLVAIGGHRPIEETYAELCRAFVPYIEREVLAAAQEVISAIAAGDWDVYFGRSRMEAGAMLADFHAHPLEEEAAATATATVTGTSAEVRAAGKTRAFTLEGGRWMQTNVR